MPKINEKNFKTKKAAYEYTKKKLYEMGCRTITEKDPENFNFLCSLVSFKMITHCLEFELFKLPQTKDALHLRVKTHHSPYKTISWCDCARQTDTNHNKLAQAMRNAVKDNIYAFKATQTNCAMCKKEEKEGDIDHIEPFAIIKKDFTELYSQNGKTPPEEFSMNEFSAFIFKPENKEFEEEWTKYHNERAKYQLLCKKCHKEKTKKDRHLLAVHRYRAKPDIMKKQKKMKIKKQVERTKKKLENLEKTLQTIG